MYTFHVIEPAYKDHLCKDHILLVSRVIFIYKFHCIWHSLRSALWRPVSFSSKDQKKGGFFRSAVMLCKSFISIQVLKRAVPHTHKHTHTQYRPCAICLILGSLTSYPSTLACVKPELSAVVATALFPLQLATRHIHILLPKVLPR